MRDEPFNPYTDVAREAFRDYDPEPDERPSDDDLAEFRPPKPFTTSRPRTYDPIPDWSDLAEKWGRQ
jgi:hypothetical protein